MGKFLCAAARCAFAAAIALCQQFANAQTIVAGATAASWRVTESGAFSYSIPIQVPPGIAGLQPSLSLAYSSQAGNSAAGMGASLSGLSAVYRCGRTIVQDGANRGVLYDSSDKFCLDGQRLVAVSGSYGADGTEYRTERESYTRIVSYGAAGSGPAFFKAWTKAGQVIEFGNTGDSRIEAQARSDARIWALNKLSDTKGNYLTVSYDEDNANGDFRPTRIDYTGNASAGVSTFASVRFTYEARTDFATYYVGGAALSTRQRLVNVKTYLGETIVKDYRIAYTYAPSNGPSLATSVQECTGDGAYCLNPISLGWNNPVGTLGFGSASWAATNGAALGDINGDGLADLVTAQCAPQGEGDPIYCDVGFALNNGSGFGSVTNVTSFYTGQTVSLNPNTVFFTLGDVNGDGKADLVVASTLRFSNGSSFGSPVSIPGNGLLGDVNGDGLADLVQLSCSAGTEAEPSTCGISVAMSNGSGFGSAAYQGSFANMGPISLGDVNGDGRADLSGGGYVRLSNGNGFNSASIASGDGVLADVNGDGLADLVTVSCINTEAQQTCSLGLKVSDGKQLLLTTVGADGAYSPWVALGDVNGDGRADAVLGGYVRLSNTVTSAQLASVTNSLGATASITYKPLTDGSVYAKDSDAAWPVRDVREQGPLQVVSSVSASDGIGGNQTASYFYRGAKAHLQGGGFLGFRQNEATDGATGIKVVATARLDYPYRGLPTQVERRQSSGTVISRTTNTWTDAALTPAAGSGGDYHKSNLTQQVEQSYELTGALVTTVTTATTYDSFGNATTVTVGTGDGYSKLTTNTYTNDTSNWFLGRLTRSTVQSTIPNP